MLFVFKLILYVLGFLAVLIFAIALGQILSEKEQKKKEALQEKYKAAKEFCAVTLVSMGAEKIKTIKVLKEYTDWDLAMAKEKVESPLPAMIIYKMPVDLAQEMNEKLSALGNSITIDRIS